MWNTCTSTDFTKHCQRIQTLSVHDGVPRINSRHYELSPVLTLGNTVKFRTYRQVYCVLCFPIRTVDTNEDLNFITPHREITKQNNRQSDRLVIFSNTYKKRTNILLSSNIVKHKIHDMDIFGDNNQLDCTPGPIPLQKHGSEIVTDHRNTIPYICQTTTGAWFVLWFIFQ